MADGPPKPMTSTVVTRAELRAGPTSQNVEKTSYPALPLSLQAPDSQCLFATGAGNEVRHSSLFIPHR